MALTSSRVNVGTSATLVFTTTSDRTSVLLTNRDSASMWLGDNTVTTSTGAELAAGESRAYSLLSRGETLYAVAANSSTGKLHVETQA